MTLAPVESAEMACVQEECEEAIGLFERAIWEQSGNYNLYFKLGLCYSGGCRQHANVSAEMAATYLRQALRLLGGADSSKRAPILDALGNALSQTAGASRTEALREAIAVQVESAGIYRSEGESDDWARVEFNLGNSLCELAETAGEDHWWEAVSHYEEALQVRTREKDPERHAALLENLGSAYRHVDARHAIDCYRRALQICRRLDDPERCAAIENNLGNAYLSLPETDRRMAIRNARSALQHFDRALRLKAPDTDAAVYAIAEGNRDRARWRLSRIQPKCLT